MTTRSTSSCTVHVSSDANKQTLGQNTHLKRTSRDLFAAEGVGNDLPILTQCVVSELYEFRGGRVRAPGSGPGYPAAGPGLSGRSACSEAIATAKTRKSTYQ